MMQNGDVDNFRDRNRWFNKRVVLDMAKDYIEKLKKRFEKLKLRKCKGVPYKRINGQNIFVDDFDKKVIKPLLFAVHKIHMPKTLMNFGIRCRSSIKGVSKCIGVLLKMQHG